MSLARLFSTFGSSDRCIMLVSDITSSEWALPRWSHPSRRLGRWKKGSNSIVGHTLRQKALLGNSQLAGKVFPDDLPLCVNVVSPSLTSVRRNKYEWRRRKAKASLRGQSYELNVLKKEELLLGQLQQELLELGQKVHLLSAKLRQPRAGPRYFIIPIFQGPVSCIYCTPQQSVVFPVEKEEQKRDGPLSRPHSVPLPVEQEEEVELKNNFETFPVSFVRTEV
ncbi:hypothetical protein B0H13DRAFT_2286823 [Mycena leptocephala]|nr:hypothetical protein B0H13DRAFT_2286823 [Mycena leptocephala]